MTEPTTEATTVDTTADAAATSQVVDTDNAGNQQEPAPNSEAARYRVQLREEQANHATTAERLTGYRRRECEAAVADLLDVPADLWEIGQADITAFYNEDGTVNEAELLAAAGALIEQRPRLAKPGRPPAQWGQHGGPPPSGREPGWGDVIKPT